MNQDRCSHCPVRPGIPCSGNSPSWRGYAVPSLCDRAKTGNPRYLNAIQRDAEKSAAAISVRHRIETARHIDEFTFITSEQLTRDTIAFRKTLPPDIDCVVGIARSGMRPGLDIAYDLHLPIFAVSRQAGVVDIGHGVRLENQPKREPSHVLLIDDTVASGKEMCACAPIVRERFPNARITKAVIYARPDAVPAVDMFYAIYPGSHYLEWNWCNAGHGSVCGYDFDGVISRDFTHEECVTDASYHAAMATIDPLYLPRRLPVPLIVTARPENTRDITEAWMARHGVRADRLVMRDFDCDMSKPHARQIGQWKAKHYGESPLWLFAESDPEQARIIAELTGKAVLCPAMGRVIPAKPLEPKKVNIREQLAIVAECDYRGPIIKPRCGCQGEWRLCGMGKGGFKAGEVQLGDCLMCLKAPATLP